MLGITIDGDTRVIQGFEEAVRRVGSPERALSDIGDVMIKEFSANFEEEGGRLNERWQDLAETTVRDRIRLGYPGRHPILKRTGKLQAGFRKEVNKWSVRVYNAVSYFRYHQLGEGNNPKRRMILFPERLKQEVVASITSFIHYALDFGGGPRSFDNRR